MGMGIRYGSAIALKYKGGSIFKRNCVARVRRGHCIIRLKKIVFLRFTSPRLISHASFVSIRCIFIEIDHPLHFSRFFLRILDDPVLNVPELIISV